MIRITGGTLHGQVIASPKDKAVRPTTGMVRESLFSMLQTRLPGGRFLDLFAGSGLMGIEAVSRGAEFVLAVEQNRDHVRLIQSNYQKLKIDLQRAKVVPMDVLRLVERPNREEAFDIVFADPPYGLANINRAAEHIRQNGWLKPDGVLVIENSSREAAPEGFAVKPYGDTALFISGLASLT